MEERVSSENTLARTCCRYYNREHEKDSLGRRMLLCLGTAKIQRNNLEDTLNIHYRPGLTQDVIVLDTGNRIGSIP